MPGDVLVVTGPLGGAGAAFRERSYVRPPMRLEEGKRLAADGARDAGPLRRARGRRWPPRAPLGRPLRRSSSTASRWPQGATLDDLGFGEDYELLAAVREPGRFTVIGRVEEGEGVELLRGGEPLPLAATNTFTARGDSRDGAGSRGGRVKPHARSSARARLRAPASPARASPARRARARASASGGGRSAGAAPVLSGRPRSVSP